MNKKDTNNSILYITIIWVIIFSAINIIRHNCYNSYMFDFGNMLQAFNSLKQGRLLEISSLGIELSRFCGHFEFIYILLFPFFMLLGGKYFSLIILHNIFIGFSGFFLFKICMFQTENKYLSFVLFLSYLLHPIILFSSHTYIHGDSIALFFCLGMIYFLLKQRYGLYLVFMALFIACKEYMAFYVILLSLIFCKNKKVTYISILYSVIWLALFFGFTRPYLRSYYGLNNYLIAPLFHTVSGKTLPMLFIEILKNPIEMTAKIIKVNHFSLIISMFFPVIFFSILSLKFWIIFLPFILVILLTGSLEYSHRLVTLVPVIYVFAIIVIKRMPKQKYNLLSMIICIFSVFSMLYFPPVSLYFKNPKQYFYKSCYYKKIDKIIAKIPKDKSVLASNNIASHLADRRYLYVHNQEVLKKHEYYDYIINPNIDIENSKSK